MLYYAQVLTSICGIPSISGGHIFVKLSVGRAVPGVTVHAGPLENDTLCCSGCACGPSLRVGLFVAFAVL